MAILHGSWILEKEKSCLFIWGETWRKFGAIDTIESGSNLPHPLAMTESEFKTFLNSLQQSGKLNWQLPETAESPPEKSKKTRRSPKTQNAEITAPNSSIQREIRAIALPTQISESNASLMPQHSAAALEEPAKPRKFTFIPGKSRVFVSTLKQLLFSCNHYRLTARNQTILSARICVFGLILLGGVWICWQDANFCRDWRNSPTVLLLPNGNRC